jgi:hypothetical protein
MAGAITSNPQFQNAMNMAANMPQQPGQVGQTSVPPGQPPFGGGLNKPFVNAPYQPATNMMSETDFNGFLQRQNEMQAANPTANFVNPMTTYQNYVNEVNQGQQTVANNVVSAQERARRGIIGQGNDMMGSAGPFVTQDSFGNRPMSYYQGQPQRPQPQTQPMNPGYGQRPQRGPAPRDMMPGTLQQGLGGLRR